MFCWEQGAALAAVKPSLEAAGCSLLTVGIGTPEKAREFAERVGYPVEDLYTDETRAAYKALEMYGDLDGTEGMFFDPKVVEGVRRLFFTRITGERIKERGQEGIRKAMENYKPLMPSEPRDTVQQGGTFVFRGTETLFAHKDEATADHADLALVVEAAAAGAAAVQQQASQ